MHKVNFLEVYYYIYQRYSEEAALKLLEDIKISPIKTDTEITDDILIKYLALNGEVCCSPVVVALRGLIPF